MPVVSSLFVYPIKSCAGIALESLEFDERGPKSDRHWMLVDDQGQFITQRESPVLATVQPRWVDGELRVRRRDGDELSLPNEVHGTKIVRVWNFESESDDLGDKCASWFSETIGKPCRLVRFSNHVVRRTSRRHTSIQSQLAFADGYPVLLTSVESLGALNQRLTDPVAMNRFRPNIVIRDAQPFAEDGWSSLTATGLELAVVKACERCVITTVNQTTGEAGKEPLRALAKFRKMEGKVVFGQNCLHMSPGILKVGDRLSATESST